MRIDDGSGSMADVRSQKNPPDLSIVNEIAPDTHDSAAPDELTRMYLALEAVRQQARTLGEEMARQLAKLGLPAPPEDS